ncbi:transcription factor tga7 [Quercus suber]|uniref:Transcription factor tga7 n=1 Tax=Quercus suber TaxID=58331 RepID=A0AAW0LTZ1_QUESU
MGIYEPFQQVSMWGDTFKVDSIPNASTILQVDARLENKTEFISHDSMGPSGIEQEANKPGDKVQRRLAQNREAARKSRLRKKGVYICPPDTSHVGFSGNVNSGIAAFEMEYAHWVEEQNRQICELRNALQAHITDVELNILVENGYSHYYNLFRMKADAAKADVFYLISGVWRTSAERFFHWIGGFRPSELLNVLLPQLEPLTDTQIQSVRNLRRSSQQAEDALSQGMDKLQQSLAQNIGAESVNASNYGSQMIAAMEKLEALEGFVNQADHLRQQTLQQMCRILTIRQSARGLLGLGEYFHRLRALSSLWSARPREPA